MIASGCSLRFPLNVRATLADPSRVGIGSVSTHHRGLLVDQLLDRGRDTDWYWRNDDHSAPGVQIASSEAEDPQQDRRLGIEELNVLAGDVRALASILENDGIASEIETVASQAQLCPQVVHSSRDQDHGQRNERLGESQCHPKSRVEIHITKSASRTRVSADIAAARRQYSRTPLR